MSKTIGFQVSDKDYEFLKYISQKHNQSMSREIREALKAYYEYIKNEK